MLCVIEVPSVSLHDVRVQPERSEPFELDLEGVPARVVWRGDQPVLEVLGPLVFSVDRPLADLPVRTETELSLVGGRLVLAAGVAPTIESIAGASARARLPLQGLETAVALPCDALTLDEATPALADIAVPAGGHRFTRLGSAELYAAPEAADGWPVSLVGPLQVVREQDGWVELLADYTDGSRITGWTRASDVRIEHGEPLHGHRGIGGRGAGSCSRDHGPPLEWTTLEAGTEVFDAAHGRVWARVSGATRVGVFPPDDDGWVRVGQVPGLPVPCGEHERIWLAPATGRKLR